MGMFDYVALPCPHCGETHVEQTKAGDCHLKTITLDRMSDEMAVAECLLNPEREMHCEHCGERIYLRIVTRPSFEVSKSPPRYYKGWDED